MTDRLRFCQAAGRYGDVRRRIAEGMPSQTRACCWGSLAAASGEEAPTPDAQAQAGNRENFERIGDHTDRIQGHIGGAVPVILLDTDLDENGADMPKVREWAWPNSPRTAAAVDQRCDPPAFPGKQRFRSLRRAARTGTAALRLTCDVLEGGCSRQGTPTMLGIASPASGIGRTEKESADETRRSVANEKHERARARREGWPGAGANAAGTRRAQWSGTAGGRCSSACPT